MAAEETPLDRRVLVLPPTQKDGSMTREVMRRAGIDAGICAGFHQMAAEVRRGVAAVLLPEESLNRAARWLGSVIAHQEPWSDLPVLVLTRPGADSFDVSLAVTALGNVTLIERPVRVATLVSAVRTALRARERQYQIRRQLDELRMADQRKDEFLATLGHELRNPLSPMLTSLELLKRNGPLNLDVVHLVAVMQRQAGHLARLVDDLLEVSRITRGLIAVKHDPVNVADVVAGAVETSRPVIEASEHTLTLDLPDEPLIVRGDSVRLTQVFANLLNNAAKYTDPRGVITLTVRRRGQAAVVGVRDNGIGIDRGHLSSVFDMFTQVSRSDRRTQGGLGIGLTLVRSLVELHGGSVEASSDGRGRGSTFQVTLPVAAEPIVAQHPDAVAKALPGRRVLIVDDNHDAAETLQTLLQTLGVTVTAAENGHEALRMFGSFEPDAVLLDIGMPGMDGYEVARRIRTMPSGNGVQLIALTGWGQQEDVRRCFEAGFNHHLVKPFDLEKLWDLIARHADRARAG